MREAVARAPPGRAACAGPAQQAERLDCQLRGGTGSIRSCMAALGPRHAAGRANSKHRRGPHHPRETVGFTTSGNVGMEGGGALTALKHSY